MSAPRGLVASAVPGTLGSRATLDMAGALLSFGLRVLREE